MPTNPTYEAIERLREDLAFTRLNRLSGIRASADDLSALLSLLDQTREALRPFSEAAAECNGSSDASELWEHPAATMLYVIDLRKAAALLAQMEKPS